MKFPSKFISYKDSVFSKFPILLKALEERDLSVKELYRKVRRDANLSNMQEYLDVLDCLFALGKITLEEEVLHYVETN